MKILEILENPREFYEILEDPTQILEKTHNILENYGKF